MEERRRDIPADLGHLPSFPAILLIKLFTLNRILHVISHVTFSSAPREANMAGHARNRLESPLNTKEYLFGGWL